VPLVIEDAASVVMGKEPVRIDGRPVGYVTSAAMGYTIGKPIAYAWLPPAAAVGTKVTIDSFGERIPATVGAEPLVDPKGEKLRA
jgi:glycine cleavage system aminomethyltransferase T